MNNIILIAFILRALIIQTISLDLEKIRSDILTNHNYHRKRHQVDALERSEEIEKVAQAYSEHLAEIEQLVHSHNGYGENLYYCWASNSICVTGEKASQSWYSEVSKYNFNSPGYIPGTGHFSQLVWKGSKKIGCGAACNSKNKCYVSCNYSPAGNDLNHFGTNVFPLKEDSTGNSSNSQGMSTAGKAFLGIFIIILILLIAFSVFHFIIRKRKFGDIKNYFVRNKY